MPGPTLSKNTADFELLLGGRLLLESVTPGTQPDGYLLEDGSGVLLLDCVTPSLGDPVTFTNPNWSGRVVSVAQNLIVDGAQRNYKRVSVTATNQTADPGGTAPGDFSDVPAGGYYLQEDGIGKLILEDSSGDYLLEGTSFAYRELSVRQSQNQDGTTTTYGSLVTFEGGFQAGQTFLLTNNDLGYAAQSFAITNVTIDFIGAGTPTPRYRLEFGDAYQTLQLAGGGVLTRTASVATQQLGVVQPAGTLGYAEVTTAQGTYTALTDLTGLSLTVTVGSGRRIEVSGFAGQGSSVGTDTLGIAIRENGTTLQFINIPAPGTTGGNFGPEISVTLLPTAGVHTYNLSGQRVTGSGNVTMAADGTHRAWLKVLDTGT